jgi:hypothetical protein
MAGTLDETSSSRVVAATARDPIPLAAGCLPAAATRCLSIDNQQLAREYERRRMR